MFIIIIIIIILGPFFPLIKQLYKSFIGVFIIFKDPIGNLIQQINNNGIIFIHVIYIIISLLLIDIILYLHLHYYFNYILNIEYNKTSSRFNIFLF